MSIESHRYSRSFLVFPLTVLGCYWALMYYQGTDIDVPVPGITTLLVLGIMVVLEFVFRYRNRVSQKKLFVRDVAVTLTNLWGTIPVSSAVFFPVILYLPELFFGRSLFFASFVQLGPFWLQLVVIILAYSLLKYFIHWMQHSIPLLWVMHSYHHSVTDLQASNTYMTHPIDFAMRNVLPQVILGVIGFEPAAIVFGTGLLVLMATLSHCGAGLNAGWLNYILVTPEIHRWHHSAEVPEGHRYAVNYGVGFPLWDRIFGTFYLPDDNGVPAQPRKIGHPDGLHDDTNIFRICFLTRYLPTVFPFSKQ